MQKAAFRTMKGGLLHGNLRLFEMQKAANHNKTLFIPF